MSQLLNMPALCILFDIDKLREHIGPGDYFTEAWKVVFMAVGPNSLKDWRGSLLYECDTDGEVGGCCVAIQDMYEPLLHSIYESISRSTEYQKVAAPPMFLENEDARAQPLMAAGTIDGGGNIIGDGAYSSARALDVVKEVSSSEALKPQGREEVKNEESTSYTAAKELAPKQPSLMHVETATAKKSEIREPPLIPNVVRNTFSNPTTAAIYSEEKGLSLNEINTLIGKGELRGYSHRKILYIERTNQDALEIALSKRGPMVPNRPGEPAAPKIEHYDAENKNGESTSYTAAKEITPKITATKNPFEPEPSDKSLKTTGDDGIKIAPDHQHTSKLRLTELSELATGIGLKVCTVIGSPSGDYYTIDRGRDCLERCDSLEEVEKALTYISVSQSESPATWTIINDSLKAVPGISLPNYEVSPIIHCRHSDPNIGEISFGSELTCRQCNFSGPFPVTKPISDGFWGRSRNACPQCGSVFILNFDIRVGSDGADVYFYTDAETSGTMASTFKYPLLVIQEFH